MLQRYEQHCKTIEREEAEPVRASDWRYRGDSLEPKATAKLFIKTSSENKNKTRRNSLLLNDLTNKSIKKLQAIFTLFLEVLSL
jgi:hypothetical protein